MPAPPARSRSARRALGDEFHLELAGRGTDARTPCSPPRTSRSCDGSDPRPSKHAQAPVVDAAVVAHRHQILHAAIEQTPRSALTGCRRDRSPRRTSDAPSPTSPTASSRTRDHLVHHSPFGPAHVIRASLPILGTTHRQRRSGLSTTTPRRRFAVLVLRLGTGETCRSPRRYEVRAVTMDPDRGAALLVGFHWFPSSSSTIERVRPTRSMPGLERGGGLFSWRRTDRHESKRLVRYRSCARAVQCNQEKES